MLLFSCGLFRPARAVLVFTALALLLLSELGFPSLAYAAAVQGSKAPAAVDRDKFADPPVDFRPWLRWWWPGGDVETSELAREVTAMSAAGFGGAEIQSFAVGLPKNLSNNVPTYGSPEWFSTVGFVLGEAEKHGMKIDITLGSSWPSGGRHIDAPHSLKQLVSSSQLVKGPVKLNQLPPAPSKPLYYDLGKSLLAMPDTYDPTKMRLMALLAMKRDTLGGVVPSTATSGIASLPPLPGTILLGLGAVNLVNYLTPSGMINWDVPEGEWVIFALYQGPTGQKPFYSADGDGGLVMDHLDKASTELHLSAIADKGKQYFGKYFGNTLRALFVDSLELRTELYWTESFLDQFAQRRGYRLESYLPILFKPFQADAYLQDVYTKVQPSFDIAGIGERVRQDYDRTVTELMVENFIDPISRYASLNNLTSRIQAHGGPMDLLTAYGHAFMPETEGLFADGKRSFLKIASSSAHLYDRPVVSSEILAFKDRDYMTTPADIIREANRNFAAGVNQVVLHGFPYHYDTGFLPPGWMPFSSPFLPAWSNIGTFASHLNDRYPFWGQYLPQVTRYLGRAQMIMQAGEPINSIALYTPLRSQLKPGEPDPAITTALDSSGYSYDYVSGDLLTGATVQKGRLLIGSHQYQALVVSDITSLPWELAVKIPEFAEAGLVVIFTGDIPSTSSGLFAYETRDDFVKSQFAGLFGTPADQVKSASRYQTGNALFLAQADGIGIELEKTFSIVPDVRLPIKNGAIASVHRRVGVADFYFLANIGDSPVETTVAFPKESRTPEIWSLSNGTVADAPRYTKRATGVSLPITLGEGKAIVVGFEADSPLPYVEKTTLTSVDRDPDGTLSGRAPVPGSYEVWYGSGAKDVVRAGDGLPLVSSILIPSWSLTVQSNELFGPASNRTIQVDKLEDWAVMPELKNFSGKGTYRATVSVPDSYFNPGVGVELELGVVSDACEISINGRHVASLTAGVTRTNVTAYLSQGVNEIEVVVTNTFRNHLMGLASSGIDYYKPLLLNPLPAPSGMLGPVQLIPYYQVPLGGAPSQAATAPLPFGINVVPKNYPNYTEQDVIDAIGKSRELTNNMSLSWFWWDNKSGEIRDCAKVTPLVKEARRQQMQVTLQVLSFTAFGEPLVPYVPASFANPEAKQGFLNQMACLAKLHPDFLLVAPEVNFVKDFNPAEFKLFSDFYRDIYKTIKDISPLTQVGVSYQYDYFLESGRWSSVDDIGPNQDFIGLTSYFGATPMVPSILYPSKFSSVSEVPADYYAAVRQHIPLSKPVVFTELAWSSYYDHGIQNQVDFLERMPVLLKDVKPVNTIWALEYDVAYYTDFLTGLNNIGLMYRDGSSKPAWEAAAWLKKTGVFGPQFFNR